MLIIFIVVDLLTIDFKFLFDFYCFIGRFDFRQFHPNGFWKPFFWPVPEAACFSLIPILQLASISAASSRSISNAHPFQLLLH
jgi:hypothetical protein